jgi:predicted enzyme related to lactoylglutathione lyase
MFLKAHPVLPSLDLERTARFYQEQLGFSGKLLHEEVAVLAGDGIELHFWKCEDERIPASSGCRIQVTDIDDLFRRIKERGLVDSSAEMEVLRWGKIFPLNDPDGNLIWIFEGLPPWSR